MIIKQNKSINLNATTIKDDISKAGCIKKDNKNLLSIKNDILNVVSNSKRNISNAISSSRRNTSKAVSSRNNDNSIAEHSKSKKKFKF